MELRSRGLSALIRAVLGAAVIAAALLVARDAITLTGLKKAPRPAAAPSIRPPADGRQRQARDLMSYAPILSNNIFGFPAGALSALSTGGGDAATPVPETVNLKLMGVIAWPKGFGYAIFADPSSGAQEIYKTGDFVPGYGPLKRVLADRAYIDLKGKQVEVPMAEIAMLKEIAPPPAPGQSGIGVKRTSEGSYIVDQKALQSALEKPNQIMTDARLLPSMVDGKQEGFIIRDVKRGGIYDNLGLRNGDVLIRVNNFNISDPETALQAFTALKGMDRVELDIKREGSRMTLTYNIR